MVYIGITLEAFQLFKANEGGRSDKQLFESIACDLLEKGYSVNINALPFELCTALKEHLDNMSDEKFTAAGVGRDQAHQLNNFVRSNEICWITGESDAGKQWLTWASSLQYYLNKRLLLGLFSFESHFAHYKPNDFYKRHVDAFKGEANRVLSIVVYLNPTWLPEHGGELVLYRNENDEGLKIMPNLGTIAVFLSEDFPHEVLMTKRDRYSIAGWFRVNSSTAERVDPPL